MNYNNLAKANARRTRKAGPVQADLARRALAAGLELPEPIRHALEVRAAHPRAAWSTLAKRSGTTKDTLTGRYRRGIAMAERYGREFDGAASQGGVEQQSAERAVQRRLQAHGVSPGEVDQRQRIVGAAREDPEQTTRELAQRFGVTYHFAWNALRHAGVRVRADKPGRRRSEQDPEGRVA